MAENPDEIGGFKNRIKEFKYIPAHLLRGHPKNWKNHPFDQVSLLRKLMNEVGFAAAMPVRELEDGTYEILDGHARTGIIGDDGLAPALILDVTAEEGEKLLASYDPVAYLAKVDFEKASDLMRDDLFEDPEVQAMLKRIVLDFDEIAPVNTPYLGGNSEKSDPDPETSWRVFVVVKDEKSRDKVVADLKKRGWEPKVVEM